jgi:hypothetical protein
MSNVFQQMCKAEENGYVWCNRKKGDELSYQPSIVYSLIRLEEIKET